MCLAPELEQILHESVGGIQSTGGLEPNLAERMLAQINENTATMEAQGKTPVLLVASTFRLWLSRLLRSNNPGLYVLAYEEIPADKQIKVVVTVGN